MQLIDRGKLRLSDRAFDLLEIEPFLDGDNKPDARLEHITVENLLQHSGGWDRDKSYDPMFRSRAIAKALRVPCPPSAPDIIRYMAGKRLDFDPGSRHAYSNLGYAILGRIIEKATGLSYGDYVQQNVLQPIGIHRMMLGRSRIEHRAESEVKYYMALPTMASSVFDDEEAPWPYGGFCLEAMDAHGGWLASAIDLARFAAALQHRQQCVLLSPTALDQLYARPRGLLGRHEDGRLRSSYAGCGWYVRPVENGRANYWHNGSLPGTFTLLVRRWDGLIWAALFNQRSDNKQKPDGAIDPALHRAASAVKQWPQENLFGTIGL
jgi:N-acyl-D-amino-acid deacylase